MNSPIKRSIFPFVLGLIVGTAGGYLAATSGKGPADPPAAAQVELVRAVSVKLPEEEIIRVSPQQVGMDPPAPEPAVLQPELPVVPPVVPEPLTPVQQVGARFSGVFEIEDATEQLAAFQNLVLEITPGNAAIHHQAWMSGPFMQADNAETMLYNRHIGEVFGAEVVGVRSGMGPKDMMGAYSFVKDQFQGWIRTDPSAAEKWLDGLAFEPFRQAMESAWDEAALASEAASTPGN